MTSTHQELSEGYLLHISGSACHESLAVVIRDAFVESAGCGGAPDGPDLVRAAALLTRRAMGMLELGISLISDDQLNLPEETNWSRVDSFFDECTHLLRHPQGDFLPDGTEQEQAKAETELAWVIGELKSQAYRCFAIHDTYADPKGSKHNGGIHWNWVSDLKVSAVLLKASMLLLKELEG